MEEKREIKNKVCIQQINGRGRRLVSWPMGERAKGMPRVCHRELEKTILASMGYPLSVFRKKSTIEESFLWMSESLSRGSESKKRAIGPARVAWGAATHCNTLQHTATWHEMAPCHSGSGCYCRDNDSRIITLLRDSATHCNTLQQPVTHCNNQAIIQVTDARIVTLLRDSAIRCNTPQHTATHCNTLQQPATLRLLFGTLTQELSLFFETLSSAWRIHMSAVTQCICVTQTWHTHVSASDVTDYFFATV